VKLNRPVGETFEYSDLNFVVLGLLVQRVSGETWVRWQFGALRLTAQSAHLALQGARYWAVRHMSSGSGAPRALRTGATGGRIS
jgi:hypothetical protein